MLLYVSISKYWLIITEQNVDPGAASRQELQQYHDRHASFPPLNPAFDRLGNLVGCFNNEDQLVLLNQLPLAIRSRLQQQVDLARITAERERMAISQRQMLDQYRLGYKSQVDGHTFQNIMGFNPSYPVPPFHGVSSSDLQHGLFLPPAPNGRRDEPAPHKPIQHENDHRLVQHSRLQNTSEEQHSISARSEAMARSCDHDRVDQQIYIIPVFVPFRDGGYGSQRMSAHGDAHAMGSVAQYGGSDPSHSHNSRQLAIEFEHEGSSYQESRSTSGSNESADNFEPCSIPSAHEIREQFKQGVLSSISDAKIGSGEDQRAAVGPSVRREQFKNEFLSQLSTSMGGSGQARGNSSRPIHLSDLPGSLGEPESMASQVQNKRRDSIRIIEVDNSDDLVELLNIIGLPSPHVQELFFDMEGDLLSWNGPISIMQVSMASYPGVTWIIDVYRLGIETAFDTQGSLGQSLRNILTDSSIPTVWYDVRQDSWALAGQVGIKIGQAVDLQLMVHGAVECTGLTLMGLDKCVERFLTLSPEQQAEWRNGKRTGREYLNNDFSRWMMRPLPKPLRVYAAGDTVHMPQMYKQSLLILRRDLQLIQLVIELSQQRVDNTQVPNFASSGPIAPPEFAGLHRRRYGGHRSSS